MKNCVVVGGGLCGLFSAILLAERCQSVTLIESAPSCGGLLKSVRDDQGVVYDQGTHIPNTTGIDEIDTILFGDEATIRDNWYVIDELPSGSFFNGHWNSENQSVDVRHLAESAYQQAVYELLHQDQVGLSENIEDYLRETLGDTITEQVSLPIVAKLYGKGVDGRSLQRQSSVNYFGITRVVALTPETTKILKQIPAFDQKLSHHKQADYLAQMSAQGVTMPRYYYPKNDCGIEFWVEHLLSQAKAKGVEIITSEFISEIKHNDNKVTSVTLGKNGRTLPCDLLYWSAPPVFGLKAAGLNISAHKADFRTANIFYFNFDKPLTNQSAPFLWNWHGEHKTFRITLYPNLRDYDNGHYNILGGVGGMFCGRDWEHCSTAEKRGAAGTLASHGYKLVFGVACQPHQCGGNNSFTKKAGFWPNFSPDSFGGGNVTYNFETGIWSNDQGDKFNSRDHYDYDNETLK